MNREAQAREMVDHSELSVLGCRPVQATPEEQQFWNGSGMPGRFDTPYDGSIKALCFDCHREVWVGPKQQALRAERPDKVLVLDLICAAQRAVGDPDMTEVGVAHLGTRHPDDAPTN